MDIYSPLTELKGIGKKTGESFAAMGITSIGDLICRYPRDYILYPAIQDIDEMTGFEPYRLYAIHAVIRQSPIVKNTSRIPLTLATIGSEGHRIQAVWFRQPYLRSVLVPGKHVILYGKVTAKNNRYSMEQPVIYEPEKYDQIAETFQPVYSLTSGVTNNLVIKTVRQALNSEVLFPDYLPEEVRLRNQLDEYNYSLKQIHFPDSMDALITARKRLVFDEFFRFILAVQYQKGKSVKEENHFVFENPDFIEGLTNRLPFALTGAQKRVLNEIKADMTGPYTMQRLIQGDVGSGKTIIAFLLMAWLSENHYQSAIMAPTEVLARQHYETFQANCEMLGLKIPLVLLTGSLTAREKRRAYERMALYDNAIVIGTHALIQERSAFNNLALVITDEQHRFGVRQREALASKGDCPHILVMSATPIPRTLAIIIYGDMDISVVDEVPANRLPIKNCVVGTGYRPKAYEFILDQIKKGHQAYIICPFVEASENAEGENVIDYAKALRQIVPEEVGIGVLHGKMKNELKDQVMTAFSRNEIQILISTTVVEVGVNVPNATVMMVENADKFGLAQLHQLRGRVGRGDAQSYCIMINPSSTHTARKRLETLNRSNDGFFIASEDLKLRGPGDFFGIRQSGDLAFRLGDIYQDAAVLQAASEEVKAILETDPDLTRPDHSELKRSMDNYLLNESMNL